MLFRSPKRLGVFRVEQPKLSLVLRNDGSNLEDALASLMKTKPESKKSSGGVEVGVEIVDGLVDVTDATGRNWQIEQINGSAQLPRDATNPLTAKLKCQVKPQNGDAGELAADLEWRAPAKDGQSPLGSGQATLETKSLPLTALEPALRRFAGDYAVAGTLTTTAKYEWSDDEQTAGATAHALQIDNFAAQQLSLSAPQLIGRDEVKLSQLNAKGNVLLRGGRCELQNVQLESDVASVMANGAVSLDALLANKSAAGVLAVLQNEDVQLGGELDLAQLAQLLPGTLRIREGTQISSGKIQVSLASRGEDGQRHWDGKIETTNLTAVDNGRQITWEQPLRVTLAAHQSSAGPVIEHLTCQSSFLQADARGTLAKGDASVQGDLNQLAQELDQFIDLGAIKLAGKLDGGFQWEQRGRDEIVAQGQLQLTNFAVATSGGRPWHEQQLTIQLSASGSLNEAGDNLQRLDSAKIELKSGADDLLVELVEPVASPSAKSTWLIRNRVSGNLATWLPRVQALVPLAGWEVAGGIDLNETVAVSTEHVHVKDATLEITDLRATGANLFLDEPVVKAQITDAAIDMTGKVTAQVLTAQSSAIALRADNVAFQSGKSGMNVSAAIGFRGDLTRLMSWLHDPRTPVTQQFAGDTLGQLQLASENGVTNAQWDVEVKNFAYATPAVAAAPAIGDPGIGIGRAIPTRGAPALKTVWTEPELKFVGNGNYTLAKEEFQLKQFEVSSNSLQVAAHGSVTEPANRCVLDVEGQIGYDLQNVATLLRPYLGDSFEMAGRDTRQFALRGPAKHATLQAQDKPASRLASHPGQQPTPTAESPAWPPEELAGQAGLAWTSASAYGLNIGPGALQANLTKGVMSVEPLGLNVGDGKLLLAPQLYLNRDPMLLVMNRGPLLEQVHVSPEMCAMWLKYVLPLLADVTEAQGTFSVNLADTSVVPLNDPLNGEAKGEFVVHGLQVGPGPLAQEFITISQLVKSLNQKQLPGGADGGDGRRTWVMMPEQRVPFQWKDRRVYHDGLKMTVKDIEIRTRGSVGMDHSLDMVAEVPIRDEWIGKGGLLGASLKGQTLKLPIRGTMSKPHVDHGAINQLVRDAVQGAGTRAIEDQLNKGLEKGLKSLDKFLPPRGK